MIIEIFNKSVNFDGKLHNILGTKCHEWIGIKKHYHGIYGKQSAHRVIWEYHNGVIEKGKVIRHKCDNGYCVNIEHLELGTQQDNIRDMNERGRARGGGFKGNNSKSAKITREDAIFIKENYENFTKKELSEKYKISKSQLHRIYIGERWADTSIQPTREQQFLSKASIGSYNINLKSNCLEMPTERMICRYNNISTTAHRIAWIIQYGPIPEKKMVLHKCDNAKCINYEHLELGDHQQNMKDRDIRNRTASGQQHGMSKLTEIDIINILDETNKTNTELAKKYNITLTAICNIKNGKSWNKLYKQYNKNKIFNKYCTIISFI